MNAREFTRTALAGLMAVTTAIGLASGAASATELKLATFMSPKHPMDSRVMTPMAQELAKLSGGKLTVRIYPAGELGKGPKQQFKRAIDGVADITFGLPGYTSSQFPRSLLIALPGLTKGAEDATRRLWAVYDTDLAGEFTAVKVLALWTNGLAVLITRDKPIRSLADLKGMKIRAPDAVGAKTLAAWGAIPVSMPAPKIYNAMNTGIVDGVLIGASGIRSFKLHEVGKYFTTGLPSVVTPFYLVMNKGTWQSLSAAEQAQIEQVTGPALSAKAAQVYARAAQGGLKFAADKGGEIITLDAAAAAEFRAANQAVYDALSADLQAKGIDGKAIIADLEAAGG